MRITAVRTRRVHVPFPKPIGTSIHHIEGVACVLVWVETDAGITGESYLWTIGAHRLPVLEAMVRLLADKVAIGRDPRDTGALAVDMWREINFLGHKGVSLFGLAAIDMACWDILGKDCGRSVGRLLGRCRDRITAYASEGLWASASRDELVAEACSLVERGFRFVKMRIGLPDPDEDVARVAAVREAIGPGIGLMVDANQGLTVDRAIRLGRRLEEFGLVWFEEPVMAYDLAGSAHVAAALDTPVASGETEYGRYGFQDMLERGAADILMPDLERVGGVTEFMTVARMAHARDVPVSPHVFTEQSLQLCAALPNCSLSEHMPWFAPLFRESMEMQDGDILIPDRPGFGFTFDLAAVERFALDREG